MCGYSGLGSPSCGRGCLDASCRVSRSSRSLGRPRFLCITSWQALSFPLLKHLEQGRCAVSVLAFCLCSLPLQSFKQLDLQRNNSKDSEPCGQLEEPLRRQKWLEWEAPVFKLGMNVWNCLSCWALNTAVFANATTRPTHSLLKVAPFALRWISVTKPRPPCPWLVQTPPMHIEADLVVVG
jgi:hypothetical protein